MATDAAGRGAAGGFPPAAAVELVDPLAEVPFFTMVAAAELSLRAEGSEALCALSVRAEEDEGKGRKSK